MVAFALFPGDAALLLLLLVMAPWVVLGMITDGVRMAMIALAALISLPLAGLLGQWMPRALLGGNPLWRDWGLGNAWAFLFLMVILFIVIHRLHEQATIELKYRIPGNKYEDWGRVNSVIGLSLGGIMGVLSFLVLAGKITPLGYASAQMQPAQPAEDPAGYRLTARLYRDFNSLGVDRAARVFDPAPPEYYQAADIAGLVYNNFGTNNLKHIYQFRARLMGYPGLVDAVYDPHVMRLMHLHTDNPFFMGLYNRTNLTHLLADQTLQNAIRNPDLKAKLAQVDLDDLYEFLTQGRSRQYNSATLTQQGRAPILGRWILDVDNTQQQFDQAFSGIDDRSKRNLNQYLQAVGERTSLSFSDGFFYLEAPYFHSRSLARESNDFVPRTPSVSISGIQNAAPALQVFGKWQKEGDGSSYRAVFEFRNQAGQVVSSTPVLINTFSSRIMLTLEGFHNERYVFERQKF